MIESRWALFGLAVAVCAAIQLVLWLRQTRTRDATPVDAGWAGSLALLGILYAVVAGGSTGHRLLAGALIALENLRVMLLVVKRARKEDEEDKRYQELRRRWAEKGREQLSFFVFFQAQAVLAAILSLPILLAASDEDALGPLAWIGAALWLVAATLERTADKQLADFKERDGTKGEVMKEGLWRYSRHPNYFFQWLTWVAYALVALEAPYGWLGLTAPAIMLYLILFVTGVPAAEESSLRSRGERFRRYQRETSAFVPWFPKAAS